MIGNAARLTLYALISAMEQDLRNVVVRQLGAEEGVAEILTPDLMTKAVARLAADLGPQHDSPDLATLLN